MAAIFLNVSEALTRILNAAHPVEEIEEAPLRAAAGRTLARDLFALRTQPPADVSAMDGYALRAEDLAQPSARVKNIGVSAAGQSFKGALLPGQCVRIYTGARTPKGADTIILQEDAIVEGDMIGAVAAPPPGKHIRAKGLDFEKGRVGLTAGMRLGATEIGLAAAMNHACIPVFRRPRVAILATGDELLPPGAQDDNEDKIIGSNNFTLGAMIEAAGGEVLDYGVVRDDLDATEAAIAATQHCDVLTTLGGASVGDRDHVRQALINRKMTLDFWKLAMRPGKPLIHAVQGRQSVLGLPGNPVSSFVCATLFLIPLLRKLSGDLAPNRDRTLPAELGAKVKANDQRQDFVRAKIIRTEDGRLVAMPCPLQDSSLLSVLVEADALLIRPPFAPAGDIGQTCRILPLRAMI